MAGLIAAAVLCLAPVVHDGDTIRCGQERIRIAGIDAPELAGSPRCMDPRRQGGRNPAWCDARAGAAARDALAGLLSRGQVRFVRRGQDRYGRTLASVSVNGIDAAGWMVNHGFARWWR